LFLGAKKRLRLQAGALAPKLTLNLLYPAKTLIDSAAGYRVDRRTELEAVLVVRASSFIALGRAFMKLPLRSDDHLRVGAVIARISEPGFVEAARRELAALGEG
jgi:hypothetical protein